MGVCTHTHKVMHDQGKLCLNNMSFLGSVVTRLSLSIISELWYKNDVFLFIQGTQLIIYVNTIHLNLQQNFRIIWAKILKFALPNPRDLSLGLRYFFSVFLLLSV